MKDENLPGNLWQHGRMIEIIQSSDGLVHRVKLQVDERKSHHSPDPSFKPSVIERPIQKSTVRQIRTEFDDTTYTSLT